MALLCCSSSQPGNFVLAYNTGGATKNLHVDGEDGKIKLSKSNKKFDCISDLVRYYCENDTTDLACQLSDMYGWPKTRFLDRFPCHLFPFSFHCRRAGLLRAQHQQA